MTHLDATTHLIAPHTTARSRRRVTPRQRTSTTRPFGWVGALGRRITSRRGGRTDLSNHVLAGMASARSMHR